MIGQDNGREVPEKENKEKRIESVLAKFAARIEEKDDKHKGEVILAGEVPFDIANNACEVSVIYEGTECLQIHRVNGNSFFENCDESDGDDSSDDFCDNQSEIPRPQIQAVSAF